MKMNFDHLGAKKLNALRKLTEEVSLFRVTLVKANETIEYIFSALSHEKAEEIVLSYIDLFYPNPDNITITHIDNFYKL